MQNEAKLTEAKRNGAKRNSHRLPHAGVFSQPVIMWASFQATRGRHCLIMWASFQPTRDSVIRSLLGRGGAFPAHTFPTLVFVLLFCFHRRALRLLLIFRNAMVNLVYNTISKLFCGQFRQTVFKTLFKLSSKKQL